MKRTALTLAGAALLAVAGSAYAHTLLSYGVTYRDSDLCVFGSAHIQHASAVIDSGADVMSVSNSPYLGCSGEKPRDPYGIALRRQLYRWESSSWVVCNDSGWVYNTSRTAQVYHQRAFQSAICGARYYGTMGSGFVFQNIGGWSGGGAWSDYHWLPA